MEPTPPACTLPFSPPARIAATATSWRAGLRRRDDQRVDRFHDQAASGEMHVASLLAYLVPLTASGVSDPVACAGYGPCIIHLAGRWHGCVSFEASYDGVRWHTVHLAALASGEIASEATQCGLWRTPHGFAERYLRIRAHAVRGTMIGVVAARPLPAETRQLAHAA